MDNVKTKKLTALISKLTIAANKAVKQPAQTPEPRTRHTITGLNGNAAFEHRLENIRTMNLVRL